MKTIMKAPATMPLPCSCLSVHSRKQQRGAAAIEFSIVFVLVFAVFYSMVSYAFPLLMLQSFNSASAQAVRAAIKADPESDDFVANATRLANEEATRQLSALPAVITSRVSVNTTVVNGTRVTVRIEYPNYSGNPVIPVLVLPMIGQVPRVPDNLMAEASLMP